MVTFLLFQLLSAALGIGSLVLIIPELTPRPSDPRGEFPNLLIRVYGTTRFSTLPISRLCYCLPEKSAIHGDYLKKSREITNKFVLASTVLDVAVFSTVALERSTKCNFSESRIPTINLPGQHGNTKVKLTKFSIPHDLKAPINVCLQCCTGITKLGDVAVVCNNSAL